MTMTTTWPWSLSYYSRAGYVGAKILFFRHWWNSTTRTAVADCRNQHFHRRYAIFRRFPASRQFSFVDSKCQQGKWWRRLPLSGIFAQQTNCIGILHILTIFHRFQHIRRKWCNFICMWIVSVHSHTSVYRVESGNLYPRALIKLNWLWQLPCRIKFNFYHRFFSWLIKWKPF